MSIQYVLIVDNKFVASIRLPLNLPKKLKLTDNLSRAAIFPTKKAAKDYWIGDEVEIHQVYLSLNPPKVPKTSVWIVEKTCQIHGLSVYGPYFTKKEAEEIYNSIREAQIGSLFSFTGAYYVDSTQEVTNKLGDTLKIREVRDAFQR